MIKSIQFLLGYLLMVNVNSLLPWQKCMTWEIVDVYLRLICRVKDLSQPLFFTDINGQSKGECSYHDQKLKCISNYENGNIQTNTEEHTVIFTIPLQSEIHINGNWTCWQGNDPCVANISTTEGIAGDTHVSLVGTVKNDINGKRVELQCSSCREPYGHNAEFGKDGRSEVSISYHKKTQQCGQAGIECKEDICSCSVSGNQFFNVFSVSKDDANNSFWCEMKFKDHNKESFFKKVVHIQCGDKNCISLDTIMEFLKPPVVESSAKETDLHGNIFSGNNITESPNDSNGSHGDLTCKYEIIKWSIISTVITVLIVVVLNIFYLRLLNRRQLKGKHHRNKIKEEDERLLEDMKTRASHENANMGHSTKNVEMGIPDQQKTHLIHCNSENSSDKMCQSCQEQCPQVWCMECEVNLCPACKVHHARLKMTKGHCLVEIDKLPCEYTLKFNCKLHETCLLEYFCFDHDCLCCLECIVDTHRTCHKVQSVDLASRYINPKDRLKEHKNLLSQYNDALNYIISQRSELISDIIAALKEKSNQLLEVLKKIHGDQSTNNIESIECQTKIYKRAMESDIKLAKNISEALLDRKPLLDFISSLGSPKQLFLLIYSIRNLTSDIDVKVQSMLENSKTISLHLIESSDNAYLEFEETKLNDDVPASITMLSRQKYQSQFPVQNRHHMRFTKDEQQLDLSHLEGFRISGIAVSQNDWVFLCDCIRPVVLVYDENGKYLKTIRIYYMPWDIATIPKTNLVVLTSNFDDYIQFVDTSEMKAVRSVEVKDTAECGVTCTEEYILIGSRNKIFVLNYLGIKVKTIDDISEYDSVYRYLSYQNGKLYLNGYGTNTVICVNMSDKNKYFRYHSWNLLSPKQIIFDQDGYVYALGRGSSNIIKLSQDGKCVDVPLTKEDGLKIPWSFCFSKDCKKLYVSNEKGSSVIVFKVAEHRQLKS